MTSRPPSVPRVVGVDQTQGNLTSIPIPTVVQPGPPSTSNARSGALTRAALSAMRPAQWLKNGLIFAGLVFGGRLFDLSAVAAAIFAAVTFCLLSSGFYLINDVRD